MRKFVVAIFVACAVLVATAPSHSHDLEAAQDDDDMNIMMSAFIKGQRGLIAEMKVATLMVANTVMPGFNFDVTVNTSIAHPNTNASCPHPPAAFPLFIETQFQTWIQMLHNIVAGVSYVGAMVGASMVNDEMIKTFMQSRSLLLPYPDVNGGSGFGMGFQVLCGWTQVFSFGGGGGGGAGAMSSGFGGGGGAGMETPVDIQVGGGGGCSCGNSSNSCFSCGHQQQQDDNGNLLTMAPIVVEGLNKCPAGNITVCFSGGAGGGLSSPNENCFFGAGFGVMMAITITGGGIHGGPMGIHQGDPQLCNGIPGSNNNNNNNPNQNVVSQVVQTCNAQCANAADYNNCDCPCTKNGWMNAGLTWADTITCYNSTNGNNDDN